MRKLRLGHQLVRGGQTFDLKARVLNHSVLTLVKLSGNICWMHEHFPKSLDSHHCFLLLFLLHFFFPFWWWGAVEGRLRDEMGETRKEKKELNN